MKKTIFSLLLLLTVASVLAMKPTSSKSSAQELTLPLSLLNRDSSLRYSFTVVPVAQTAPAAICSAEDIATAMERLLADGNRAVEYTPELDTVLVDVVFRFDGQSLCFRNHRIEASTAAEFAEKGAGFLEKMFYSGLRPSYSTVFSGDDGRYAEYRIPSVVALPSGRIVAFTEARQWHKDQAENDIVARWSDDAGRTWSRPVVVDEQGASSLNNICAVYIAERDHILVMYQSFPPKMSEGSISAQGEQLKIFTITSGDGGESWSSPRDITPQAMYPGMNTVCSGPGIAIRAAVGPDQGRILVPFNANGNGRWFNYVVYSDDLGDTWHRTEGHSGYGANESQIVQTDPTQYLINARSHRYPDFNAEDAPRGWNPWNFTRVTRNRVQTELTLDGDWEEWGATEVRYDQPDPTCQGSVVRISGLGVGKKEAPSRILLSNPASQYTMLEERPYANTPPRRINGTVKLSYDEGKTWTLGKRIFGNRFTEYQYSVLVDLGGGKIGCLFEVYPDILFATFDLEWLTGGEDTW